MKLHKRIAESLGYDLVRVRKNHFLKRHLANLLRLLEINCVIDVGANVGQYGGMLRAQGYRGRIVSFEPVRQTFAELERATQSDPDWRVHRLALGQASGIQAMHVPEAADLASFHRPNAYSSQRFGRNATVAGVEDVPIEALDTVFEQAVAGLETPRVLLKLDTQGYDLEVLQGARAVLPRVCALQSEISVRPLYEGMPDYIASLTEFRRLGYEITGLFPVVRDKKTLVVIEFDCVMRRVG